MEELKTEGLRACCMNPPISLSHYGKEHRLVLLKYASLKK